MNDYIAFSAYFGAALTLIIYVVSFRISDRIGHPAGQSDPHLPGTAHRGAAYF